MLSIFTIELFIRLIIFGPSIFFKKNFWDIILISLSWVGQIEIFCFDGIRNYGWTNSLSYTLQALRVFRIVRVLPFIKNFFRCIKKILPEALAALILIILFLLIYAIVAVDLFCYLKPQKFVDGEKIHFRSVGKAMLALTKIITFEEWHLIMADCVRHIEPNFVCVEIKNFADYEKYGNFL